MREEVGAALRWFAGLALHLSLSAADWVVALADRIDPPRGDEEPPDDRAFEGFVPVTESMSDRSDMGAPRRQVAPRPRPKRVPDEPSAGSLDERLRRLRRIQ